MNIENLCMGCFSQLNYGDVFCTICGYNQSSNSDLLYHLPPRTILSGKYMVGRVLGEGGFGITYVGYDLNLDIKIAIKEFYPSGFVSRSSTLSTTVQPHGGEQGDIFIKGRERFVDEAKRLARFRVFAGIVMVNDFFVENGTAYIVMEYVDGQTLKGYLAQVGGRLPATTVLEMLRPIFSSLAQVHESGIIHRDISPDNIMITPDGSVKLLDFGAAREFGEEGKKSLSVLLKHGYAPAEQYQTKGKQGPHTDVYALSATIYKAITGITPESSMDRVFEDKLEPPSMLGVQLYDYQEAALMKGLAVRQQDRYQTMRELYVALGLDTATQAP
ncbi:MAG: serine/threonine protein kinase, partial [Oscillospiraceae bacterium]|nr:serine/threonine protein kinase [Oscillospiraceae bacterium]